MLRKLLGVAVMAASSYAFAPAQAARIHAGIGCSGEDQAKVESAVEAMADGPAKFMAEREVAQAQDALLSGKAGGCAMHLSRAIHTSSATEAPYANSLAQAPDETTQQTPSQPQQWEWQPLPAAK